MKELEQVLYDHLLFIYGQAGAEKAFPQILQRVAAFRAAHPDLAASSPEERLSERDSILITYGDMLRQEGEAPLETLASFLENYLSGVISTVHILPFFPYSSDDGFSVINYKQVNPDFGDWEDVAHLGNKFRLMFDAVVNHTSSQSTWFQGFLAGNPDFEDYFTVIPEGSDLSRVFRPRATPVLTPFNTPSGEKLVWTTFSADQIDLNFANPEVLIEVIDILLFYAAHGAEFIRLDAVTFVWKEVGTSCINSPYTHRIVQTIRTLFDMAAPKVAVITETNVPHEENIAYFGNGSNEAQMVYNFALPLLTLHAFHHGDVRTLSDWAETLELPSEKATFFNFLASHDGVGMLPVQNILNPQDLVKLEKRTQKLGGFVSYKNNEDGSQSPYELNINYLDALCDPENLNEPVELIARRFLASQSIMLALRGVPGIYFHSLFGSRNWREGIEHTSRYRTINRQKLSLTALEDELANPNSLQAQVFNGFRRLLGFRRVNPAFHPWGGQRVPSIDKTIFAVLRTDPDGRYQTLCLTNVTSNIVTIEMDAEQVPEFASQPLQDLLDGERFEFSDGNWRIETGPYQVRWLQKLNLSR